MTLIPDDSFIAPVDGDSDLFKFVIPMEAKALEDGAFVVVEDNGDLTIEGYAAVWEGDDRQGENFAPGAFQKGTKAFLEAGGPICFHHKHDQVLGTVTELEEDDKGLRMKGRIDGAIAEDPILKTKYQQIKNGTLKALSVGGFFRRAIIEGKRRIADMDFTEISVTGVPIHTGPSFAVVAGKALLDDVEIPTAPEVDGEVRDEDVRAVEFLVGELNALLNRIGESVSHRTEPTPAAAA